MSTIITGNFQRKSQAQQALSDLAGAGFTPGLISTFFVNVAGERDSFPIERDDDEAPESIEAPELQGENDRMDSDVGAGGAIGAAVGGAIGVAVGLASVPVLGPGGAVVAVGVAAYAGSVLGAISSTEEQPNTESSALENNIEPTPKRKSGMLVAVAASVAAQQQVAIDILRSLGATDIENPEGNIVAGVWCDFNSELPLKLVAA